jgi:uncharacterized integral membrane protein (TIGR00698 family)
LPAAAFINCEVIDPLQGGRILAADLFCDTEPVPSVSWREFVPGLLVALAGTLAAAFISGRYGAPLTLMALLIGLALNFLGSDARLTPGLNFASRSLLRWGIVLVGVRITFGQVLALGPLALLTVVAIVSMTIGAGIAASRWLRLPAAFGMLAGGAVAICGASAAMALATTLGDRRISQAQLTMVLVGISAMSSSAMVIYPLIAHALHLSDLKAGFLLGASIHDVAQSLGAGYSYSKGAGDIAAIVKLTRVTLLAPLLTAVALFLSRNTAESAAPILPWFVAGFFGLAALNSLILIPPVLSEAAESAASGVLATAVTATAIRSPLSRLQAAGLVPFLVLLAATIVAFALSLGGALLLVR